MIEDECVKVWRSRSGANFGKQYALFCKFQEEVLSKDAVFMGMGLSELVEWQCNARGREQFRLLGLMQSFVDSLPRLRHSSKGTYLSWLRSAFMHNHAPLPVDRSFHFRSVVEPVEGNLSFEALRKILFNSSLKYKAVFSMMVAGLMGCGELTYVNTHHSNVILEALTKRVGIVKLTLPGRKKTRNKLNFYTMVDLGNSDCAEALRAYLKSLDRLPNVCLFENAQGKPLNRGNIQRYFLRRAVSCGLVKPSTPKCSRCGGETVTRYRLKDGSKKACYVCRECRNVDWACEMSLSLSGNRYGLNPHEIRDLMRSRWRESGAKIVVAEFIMGHGIDANEYDKMKYTPNYAPKEYRLALPWLNVLSMDPRKVDRTEITGKLEEERELWRKELRTLRQRMERLEKARDERWEKQLE